MYLILHQYVQDWYHGIKIRWFINIKVIHDCTFVFVWWPLINKHKQQGFCKIQVIFIQGYYTAMTVNFKRHIKNQKQVLLERQVRQEACRRHSDWFFFYNSSLPYIHVSLFFQTGYLCNITSGWLNTNWFSTPKSLL